jgi:hypothetical protein
MTISAGWNVIPYRSPLTAINTPAIVSVHLRSARSEISEATYEPSGAPNVLRATYVSELSMLKPCCDRSVGAQLE